MEVGIGKATMTEILHYRAQGGLPLSWESKYCDFCGEQIWPGMATPPNFTTDEAVHLASPNSCKYNNPLGGKAA